MAKIKFYKVMSLPEVLEPNAMYMVKAGDNFNVYMSNAEGTSAYSVSSPPADFEDWVEAYIPPTPEDTPVPVPEVVTMKQARLALLDEGYLDQVESYIASIPDPILKNRAKIEWEYAAVVERSSALVTIVSEGLGLTQENIDNLFVKAAGYP